MHKRGILFLFGCVSALCLTFNCSAGVVYTFSYTAVSGPVESFAFSLNAPDFLTANWGSLLVFTPFTVTDGQNSWTITKGSAGVSAGVGCLVFGTDFVGFGSSPPMFGPCSFSVGGPGVSQAGFSFNSDNALPAAPGIYAARDFLGFFDTAAGFEDIGSLNTTQPTGNMSLTVAATATPETGTFSLMLIGFPVSLVLMYAQSRSAFLRS